MSIPRNGPAKARAEADELVDSEVPAAVVCAHCGDADCPGCLHEQTRSGVVAVVPWERPGSPALARLWATARATTLDAERFFESLPDGPIAPALRFAVLSELVASSAVGLLAVAALSVLAPGWVDHLLADERLALVRIAAAAVPSVAALLVAAHSAHGLALDVGARRAGARASATRALRFGLYATGWDLVMGPVGVVVVGLKEGARAAVSIARVGVGLPTRSARAFVRGCYRLDGDAARPALRASYAAAVVATAIAAIVVIGGAAWALLV